MKLVKVLLPLAAAGLIMGTASARDYDGFYGKVEQMPATGNGDWVIGGKTFKADQRTKIDHRRDQKTLTVRVTSSFLKSNRNATIAAVNF